MGLLYTKILATIGPSCSNYKQIKSLIKAGVNGFRLNFSHGSHKEYEAIYKNIKKAEKDTQKRVFIIQDLCGPKIRLGILKKNIFVHKNEIYTFINEEATNKSQTLPLPLKEVYQHIKKNDHFFVNDGLVEFKIVDVSKEYFRAQVIQGGIISSKKGLNFPKIAFNFFALTKKDIKDLTFNLKYPVDFIALSFVRNADDIKFLKKNLKDLNLDIPIIAKIEKLHAIKNLNNIAKVSDALMVARGDLAVEAGFAEIGLLQRKIIKHATQYEIPVIIATQMMESMIENPFPTRAEITDITNAVLEGADCLMLSGETAIGKYPIKVIKIMKKIIKNAENFEENQSIEKKIKYNKKLPQTIIPYLAVNAAKLIKSRIIVTPTLSGTTAKRIAALKPNSSIIALTPEKNIVYKLLLYRGIFADIITYFNNADNMLNVVKIYLKDKKIVKNNEYFILTAGLNNTKKETHTNMIKIEKL